MVTVAPENHLEMHINADLCHTSCKSRCNLLVVRTRGMDGFVEHVWYKGMSQISFDATAASVKCTYG